MGPRNNGPQFAYGILNFIDFIETCSKKFDLRYAVYPNQTMLV